MTAAELAETCAHVTKAIGVDPWRVRATVTAGEEGPVVILEFVELAITPDPEVLAGIPARWSTQAEREDLHVRAAHHFRRVLEQERQPDESGADLESIRHRASMFTGVPADVP